MYGCSHLECLCGAHWCWGCQQPWEGDCACFEDDDYCSDEDEETEASPDVAGDVEGEAHAPAGAEGQTGDSQQVDGANEDGAPLERQNERNLDAHGQAYWDQRNINFGDEPTEEQRADLVWNCGHNWDVVQLEALEKENIVAQVECHLCWRVEGSKVKCSQCTYCGMVACITCKEKC